MPVIGTSEHTAAGRVSGVISASNQRSSDQVAHRKRQGRNKPFAGFNYYFNFTHNASDMRFSSKLYTVFELLYCILVFLILLNYSIGYIYIHICLNSLRFSLEARDRKTNGAHKLCLAMSNYLICIKWSARCS